MSAGQRAVLARNEGQQQEAKKRFDQSYENIHLQQQQYSDEQQQQQQQQHHQFNDYEDEVGDYDIDNDDDERAFVTTTSKSHKRIRGKYKSISDKRHRSKASSSSTIGPKLQNLQLIRSSM